MESCHQGEGVVRSQVVSERVPQRQAQRLDRWHPIEGPCSG